MRRVPDEPVPDDASGFRAANARLRELLADRDAEIAGLRADRDTDRELIRRLGLRLAELALRPGTVNSESGAPSSKEGVGAKEARGGGAQAERGARGGRA